MDYWYDYKLIALSMVVAVIASQISLAMASRIKSHRKHVGSWLLAGASAMGIGIWAMHFIGMLAYHMPIPIGYDIPLTLLSLLLAIVSSVVALYVIISSEKLSWSNNALGALMMGAGIAGMHYTGVYAMQMSPAIEFDTKLLITSLLIAYIASFIAIRFAFVYSTSDTFFDLKKSIAAVIMGGAISGMHYTAMEAQFIDPNAVCLAAGKGLSVELVAALVISVVMAILMITGMVLNSDLKSSQRERSFALQIAEDKQRSLDEAERLAVDLSRESLRNSEFANQLVDTIGAIVVVLDRNGIVIRFNHAAERVTGFSREEIIDMPVWEKLIVKGEQAELKKQFHKLDAITFPNEYASSWQTSTGELRLIDWANTALFDDSGEVEFVISSGIDITEQHANDEALRIAAVAFNTNEAMVITDAASNILRVNKSFCDITGYEKEEVIGRKPSLLQSERHDDEFYQDMWSQINTRGFWVGEIWNKRKNGEVYPELLRITAVRDDEDKVKHYVGSFSDMSQLKKAEEQLTYISNYDQPTGLPNHQLFTKLLNKEMLELQPSGERGLLLYIRFMQLGLLNKSLGLSVIDKFLERFIERIREQCGIGAIIGRASGSSVLAALPQIGPDHILSSRGSQVAEALIQSASSGEFIDGSVVSVGINIGIASFPEEGLGARDVMQNAFVALDKAMQTEGPSYHFFSEELHQTAIESYQMELALRAALSNGELKLYYQPQVDLHGQVYAAEALLRWQHDGNFVSPAKFIPLAEQSDLIHEIGDFVFREGIRQLAQLRASGLPEDFDCISLNMSAKQFQDSCFIDKLKNNLIEFALPPEFIKIELTETALMADPQQAINTINALKELGIRISLDDFGTGYSSLSYLHRIPIDQLKIDQSFVRDITINKVSRSITETIILMAQSMDIDVIAEGVETKEEKELLESFGCHHYQGYYFHRPMPANEFVALVLGAKED